MTKERLSTFVFLLLLVGCAQQVETTNTGKAFVGGTTGLELSFLSGQPPVDVFDSDNPFSVGIKVENKGEFDIINPQDVIISITGINPSDFRVSSGDLTKRSSDQLNGVKIDASGNTVAGDVTTVDFPEMNYYTSVAGTVPFTLRANVCYEYGTKAQGRLCVRKDLRGVTGETGVCNPERVVPAENSGAPVQITNIRQNIAGANKIDFFFTVKKVGPAADSLHKTATSCDTAVANRDVVYVEVQDTGLGQLTCTGLKDGMATSGFVTLFNGEREIRCSQTINTPEDFEKVVEISLKYNYKQYVDTQITVKHASS